MALEFIVGSVWYFWIFGLVNLVWMAVSDVRKGLVDDRKNFFMLGVALSLLSHVWRPWWYVMGGVLMLVVLGVLNKRFGVWGEGDMSAFRWIVLGLWILEPVLVVFYGVVLGVLTLVQRVVAKLVFKEKGLKLPYFVVIGGCFVLMMVVFYGMMAV